MGSPTYRQSTGRKIFAGLFAAGIATSVLYSVTGSAVMLYDDDENKSVVSEMRDVAAFSRIHIKGAVDLELTAGEDQSLEIETRADYMKYVTTEVSNGTLIIDMEEYRDRKIWDDGDVDVVISLPMLEEIEVSGAVDADLHDIDSDELLIEVRGAADMDVEGKCGTFTLEVKGAGDIDADKLKCETVEVDVKGAGSASVYASDTIDARVSGVASISIYGQPKNVSQHSGGLSSISIK
jgi:hypothetical protein